MRYLLLFAVLVLLLSMPGCKKGELQRAVVGKPAPSFAVTDLDGRTVRLSDFRGRVVVIDFWATWCAPCKESTKEFEALHRKYEEHGVVMIGISMDRGEEGPTAVRRFVKEQSITYLVLMDDGRTSDSYAVRNIPATYILDRDQVLVKTYPGFLPGLGERIARDLDGLLANK